MNESSEGSHSAATRIESRYRATALTAHAPTRKESVVAGVTPRGSLIADHQSAPLMLATG